MVAGKKEQDYVMRTDAKSDKAPNKHNLNFSSSIGVHGVSGIAFMGAHGCQNRQSLYSNTEIACCEGAPISRRLFQHHERAVTTKARAARFNSKRCRRSSTAAALKGSGHFVLEVIFVCRHHARDYVVELLV